MLKNTFCHIPGIGVRTEQQLWDLGIHSWDHFGESTRPRLPLGKHRKLLFDRYLDQSIVRLQSNDPGFFSNLLPSDQHWRLFPEFRDGLAYLDIETTGMGPPDDYITTIALFDGKTIFWYVQGNNLERFEQDIENYRVIVTYNGKCFDVPFIRNALRLRMEHVHIDLRYVLASLGYRGGLKGCERKLGIDREELDGVDGYFAVMLWDEYQRNQNQRALETLLAYNILDVVNLETLMVHAYNMKVAQTPFALTHRLPLPSPRGNPFTPDRATIEAIRNRLQAMSFLHHDGSFHPDSVC
jgi:uncharacterized protein YprB with RNaseH-like and TPR domain